MLYEAFGRAACASSCSGRCGAATAPATAACSRCARLFGVRGVATNDVHVHDRGRGRAAGRARRHRAAPAARGLRGRAARQPRARAQEPARDGARCSATCPRRRARRRELADRLRFDLTQDLGYRYPAADDTAPMPSWRRSARSSCERRYRGARAPRRGARRGSTRSCALIRHHGLSGFFLLHREILEIAREIAIAVRGPALGAHGCCRPAAGVARRSARSSAT